MGWEREAFSFHISGQGCPSKNLGAKALVHFPGRWYITHFDMLMARNSTKQESCVALLR